jgi:hypothetical protein
MSRQSDDESMSDKLLEAMKAQTEGPVDLAAMRRARKISEDAQIDVLTRMASLAGTAKDFPSHTMYTYVQNQVHVMISQLLSLPAMDAFNDAVCDAEEDYQPGWPPGSPISESYFGTWTAYDLPVGPRRETLGQVVVAVAAQHGTHPDMVKMMQSLQESRMGISRVLEQDGGRVRLRELAGGDAVMAEMPSGYVMKRKGELWLTRVLPPTRPCDAHVVFTSPYVLIHPSLSAWTAYVERAAQSVPGVFREQALEQHFKWGPNPRYWPDFIFEGYDSHEAGAIFLVGLPDVPESRPHSPHFKGLS